MLIVALPDLGNVFEALLDEIVLVVHISGLKLLQSDLYFRKTSHLNPQFLLDLFASGEELVENEDGLGLCFHNDCHIVHDSVHALHHTLLIILHPELHHLEIGWEARFYPIGNVLKICDELFAD